MTPMTTPPASRPRAGRTRQRGATLLEAVLAFAIAALATVGAGRALQPLRAHADAAQQRTVALGLAAAELETARGFVRVGEPAGTGRFEDLVASTRDVALGNATYRVATAVDDAPGEKRLQVTVTWPDRLGRDETVRLDGIVAGVAPAHVAALGLAGGPPTLASPGARMRRIPPGAVRVGSGQSAWWPARGEPATRVLVFDDATGDVLAHCDATLVTLAELAAGSRAGCDTGRWLLVGGVVRFAGGAERPLHVTLEGAGYAAPAMCRTDLVRTLRHGDAVTGYAWADVAAGADAAALGLATPVETGERAYAWRCLVQPDAGGWSGRAEVRPDGWSFAAAPGGQRLCRIAVDRDGSGAIDRADEHPATWSGVTHTLTAQNFLVVSADSACEDAGAVPA